MAHRSNGDGVKSEDHRRHRATWINTEDVHNLTIDIAMRLHCVNIDTMISVYVEERLDHSSARPVSS